MKSGPQTFRYADTISQPERRPPTLQQTSFVDIAKCVSKPQILHKPQTKINRSCDDEHELVRYMSKVPPFLQHVEKKGSHHGQDEALNFGVIDWGRLERWKCNERAPNRLEKSGSESSRSAECRRSIDGGSTAEMAGAQLRDFFCPREYKTRKSSVSGGQDPNNPLASESKRSSIREENSGPSPFLEFSLDKNGTKIAKQVSPNERTDVIRLKRDLSSGPRRAKSSPLRRLLDPLVKPKVAHTTVSTGSNGPSKSTTFAALLQVTLKNGLPFFKLVVNDNNCMLAATLKTLPTSKPDSHTIYEFYSVHEIKTNRPNHELKSNKSCNLGYNVVGHMRISSFDEGNSKQCSLFGVDRGRGSEPEPPLDYESKKELAAVFVRNPSKMDDKGGFHTVVVLPGGVHGLPTKGAPSSLISRWKLGSCDCGGWDVGCKLRVLVDSRTSRCGVRASESSDSVDFFVEGVEKGKKPVFSMRPSHDGYYSVKLDVSVPLLEAFATCVAQVTCSKFPEIMNPESPGPQHFVQTIAEAVKRKTPNTSREHLPAFITCPPSSPTGRI